VRKCHQAETAFAAIDAECVSSKHTVLDAAPRIQPNQLLAACSRFSLAAAAAALFFSLSTCSASGIA